MNYLNLIRNIFLINISCFKNLLPPNFFRLFKNTFHFIPVISALAILGCGGGGGSSTTSPSGFSISGTLSGLTNGAQVTLLDNGTDSLTIKSNGSFVFPAAIASGGSYQVTISSNPTGQTCSLAAFTGSGSGVNANVSNISVVCSANAFKISGTITGLDAEAQLTLLNNGADSLKLSSNGSFVFPTPIAQGGSYQITINSNPTAQTCSISNQTGSGAGITANVTNVAIICSDKSPYIVGGSITGLLSGETLTVLDNASDSLTISQNGKYVFPTPIAPGGSYAITFGTQPIQGKCGFASGISGAGTKLSANVTNADIVCTANTYNIGGTVTGLASGAKINLENNLADPMTVGSGTFTFTQQTPYDSSYSVTTTQPIIGFGQYCDITNGTGTVLGTVTNVTIGCNTANFQITTVAGSPTGATGNTNGIGAAASFNKPWSMVSDTSGNLYVADSGNNQIRKIDTSGTVSVFAGSGASGYQNGQGLAATFNNPKGITIDDKGNLYVADSGNSQIRKIDPSGNVVLIAGSPSGKTGADNGLAAQSLFANPTGITIDPTTGNLYVADTFGNAVRLITPQGIVSTVAGLGFPGDLDGLSTVATLNQPAQIVFNSTNKTIYFTETAGQVVRQITPDGRVAPTAGLENNPGSQDGAVTYATLTIPLALAIDSIGNLYVGDGSNVTTIIPSLRFVNLTTEKISTLVANPTNPSTTPNCTDGVIPNAYFNTTTAFLLAPDNSLYYTDAVCNSIRKLTLTK